MLKPSLISAFLLLLHLTSGAQIYVLDGTEQWSHTQSTAGWFGDESTNYMLFFLKGDTVINNQQYRKFYDNRRYVHTNNAGAVTEDKTYLNEYYGALRYSEDSLKIVYPWAPNGQEEMLHKFHLSIGDTVRNQYGSITFICTKIDSVAFGNGFRKRYTWYLDYSIIEGIGYTETGLFGGVGLESSRIPICFKNNEGTYYFNGPSNCLDYLQPVSGTENIESAGRFEIIPNPNNGHFEIRLPASEHLEIEQVRICDMSGKLIYESRPDHPIISENIHINVNNGVYWLSISDQSKTMVKKFIILD